MPRWIFTCEPGWEAFLAQELACVFPGSSPIQPARGWVECQLPDNSFGTPCVALAAQCLPDATEHSAPSIALWSREIGESLLPGLETWSGPWQLHMFPLSGPDSDVGPRRCRLIESALEAWLRKKQRRLLRTLVAEANARRDDAALVQVGFASRTLGFISVALPGQRHALRRAMSEFLAGEVDVPPDRRPPSRAFRKLLEMQIRWGEPIAAGQTCIDLGASPGSWTWCALGRGASVVAIDRSPLRDDLMHHPRLTFVRGDAFRYQPPQTVDWLLSDVIAEPVRIEQLLRRWLESGWCRSFCVTIKFQGRDEYGRLERFKNLLAQTTQDFRLRRLTSNKNEVTAFGKLAP